MLDLTNKKILYIPNLLEIAFNDIKKFDAQNPHIANWMSQIEASELTDEKTKKNIANALSTKDIELKERLDKLRKIKY